MTNKQTDKGCKKEIKKEIEKERQKERKKISLNESKRRQVLFECGTSRQKTNDKQANR